MTILQRQAVQVLASHLEAQGFCVQRSKDHLTVSDGGSQADVQPEGQEIDDLRSSSPDLVLLAANAALRRAGLRQLNSTTYRLTTSPKANLGDNFEDILMRSKALARCPNPPPATLARYAPIARRMAAGVYRRFKVPLLAFGYDLDDLRSLAMVHLVTAIHRYRCGDESRDEAILACYVRQRLMEVVSKIRRKARRCTADLEKRSFADFGTDFGFLLDTGRDQMKS